MEPEIGREAAVLDHVVRHLLFQFANFFGALEQGGIDLSYAYEYDVVELPVEQPRNGGERRQAEPVETVDEQHRSGSVGVAFGRPFLVGGENLGQEVGFELLDRSAHGFIMAADDKTNAD